MPRLNKIYTRGGDGGQTRLGDNQLVPKDSPRIEALGVVDELNAHLGLAIAFGLDPELANRLREIQSQLMDLMADLAQPQKSSSKRQAQKIKADQVEALEALIDRLTAKIGPMNSFIIPGESPRSAVLHVARTVCRRAERGVVRLSHSEPVDSQTIPYLNRLSDALFIMACFEDKHRGVSDPPQQG
jgi:cob(I)alamin adenosyltransferase